MNDYKVSHVNNNSYGNSVFDIILQLDSVKQSQKICQTLISSFGKDSGFVRSDDIMSFHTISGASGYNIRIEISANYMRQCPWKLIEVGAKVQELLTATNISYGRI